MQSTWGNYVVGTLRSNDSLRDPREISLDRPITTFQTGPEVTPVTIGIHCTLLELANGNTLIWFDMEGLNNQDRPYLSMALAIISQIVQCLIFIDRDLDDTLRSSLCRIVGARMVAIDGREVTWPALKLILNPSRAPVSAEVLTAAFAPGTSFSQSDSEVSRCRLRSLISLTLSRSCLFVCLSLSLSRTLLVSHRKVSQRSLSTCQSHHRRTS
jgi:hypothetical protein